MAAIDNGLTLTIDRLGNGGDGIATHGDSRVFVATALAGERVRVTLEGERARLLEVLDPSPHRVAPVCRHFGRCGGCVMQYLALDGQPYRAWKEAIVADAMASKAIDHPQISYIGCVSASRRRAVFSANKTDEALTLGFHLAGSHSIFDLDACPVLSVGINRNLPLLRLILEALMSRRAPAKVTVTELDNGLDIALAGGVVGKPSNRLAEVARLIGDSGAICRISVDGEVLLTVSEAVLSISTVAVPLPPGGFVQAVAAAETAMADLVASALARALRKVRKPRIADLFAGLGTFSYVAARFGEVDAMESDKSAVAAMERATLAAKGLKRIRPQRRDLHREPLGQMELAAYSAVVLDPPRAGAEAQVRTLANSAVPLVVMVSCYPPTLARDLRHLVDGGYVVTALTAIDQFVYSDHVETVAILEKGRDVKNL